MTADTLLYKPDWPQAQKRIIAFWERCNTDRPCIDVRAPKGVDLPPVPAPESLEARYFDADYIAASWLRYCESTYFGGEALPISPFLMGGYALGCGPRVRFAETTVWHPVTMASMDAPLGWWPGPQDPWRQKLDRVLKRLLDLAPGKFLVGHAGQVMANDLLALLRGSQDFLIDLAEDAGKCRRRLEEMLVLWIENQEHFRALVSARQPGCAWGWPGLWHPDYVKLAQSDLSCMISPALFDRYVMADLDLLGERYGRIWYHLDGPRARHHLRKLLSLPYIVTIQYVPGDGVPPNGPAWLDLYREVQAAGRGLDIDAPPEHVEFLIRHLRPEGLILRTSAPTPEAAEELLHNARRWCGSNVA